ncbi:MAG: ribose 5-phosphate isomerase B [Dethiobacteria bacterium]
MKIVLASDHAGFTLKEIVKEYLMGNGILYEDFGTYNLDPVDYPDFAYKAAAAVRSGKYDKGILLCGTGIGVAITANKLPGIRAACCSDCFTAQCARSHNDANILTLGARVVGNGLALKIVDVFLKTPFEGGRHHKRVEKIKELEKFINVEKKGGAGPV